MYLNVSVVVAVIFHILPLLLLLLLDVVLHHATIGFVVELHLMSVAAQRYNAIHWNRMER